VKGFHGFRSCADVGRNTGAVARCGVKQPSASRSELGFSRCYRGPRGIVETPCPTAYYLKPWHGLSEDRLTRCANKPCSGFGKKARRLLGHAPHTAEQVVDGGGALIFENEQKTYANDRQPSFSASTVMTYSNFWFLDEKVDRHQVRDDSGGDRDTVLGLFSVRSGAFSEFEGWVTFFVARLP